MTGKRNLCLAGGVALNCVATGTFARRTFDDIWIQPAAGDAGGAHGAASRWHHILGNPRHADNGTTTARHTLGPAFHARADRGVSRPNRIPYREMDSTSCGAGSGRGAVADEQSRRHVPGPDGVRAAGAGRAHILADARNPKMQSEMNLKIKFRERFRPFAPFVSRRMPAIILSSIVFALHAAGGPGARRSPAAATTAEELLSESGQRAAQRRARNHTRGLLGPHPDGDPRRTMPHTRLIEDSRS